MQSFFADKSKVFFQAHPSQQSQNKRGLKNISEDWEMMAAYLEEKNNA